MKVSIVKHTISRDTNTPIVTFLLEYNRFIHSELLTHRVFSKNSASSRAIPLMTMIKNVWNNTATPVYWGGKKAGMSAGEELTGVRLFIAINTWKMARNLSILMALIFNMIGLHKQIGSRILEPFSMIKVILTGTDFDNFFTLRCHKDAQPEFQVLAKMMRSELEYSTPDVNDVHIPFEDEILENQERKLSTLEIIKISVSLCAQISYRKSDFSLKKADRIVKSLMNGDVKHSSPFEHIAFSKTDAKGNFTNWNQLRHDSLLNKITM